MNYGQGNLIIPFKGREIDMERPVFVYRNLNGQKNAKFSVMQDGLVVGHTSQIMLTNCRFIVRDSGRKRVRRQKRKNVHAFIKGAVARRGGMGTTAEDQRGLGVEILYNPFKNKTFVTPDNFPAYGAMCVIINNKGVTAAYLE